MAVQTRFLVNDKTRMIGAVTGQENYDDAIKKGYREVSAEDWDAFQLETRRLKSQKRLDKNARQGK
jgi:hypothetical protein